MEYIAKRHYFYTLPIVRFIRILILIVLAILTFTHLDNQFFSRLYLAFLSIFLMNELFTHFYIGKYLPKKKLTQNDEKHMHESTTTLATEVLLASSMKVLLKRLLHFPSSQFFLQKADISEKDFVQFTISKEQLENTAFAFAKKENGTYLTTIDLLASLVLLEAEQTTLLIDKKLKPIDISHIAMWTKMQYPQEEFPPKIRVQLWGEGIGDEWVTGWTLQTRQFTKDYTRSIENIRPLLIGRENEFTNFVTTIAKKEDNNVLLVGELGVGKENLVQAFAYDSVNSLLQENVNRKKVLELLVGALLAGVGDKGLLESRLQAIIAEVSHAENIILFIPEFQNVLGVAATSVDISAVLLPALRDGKMPIVATMTPGNYKKFMEENPLHEVFDIIRIAEPDKDTALRMIIEKVNIIEKETETNISYAVLTGAIKFAKKYEPDDYLPGSAIKLITDTGYEIHKEKRKNPTVLLEDIFTTIENKTHIKVGLPSQKEKEVLLSLEEELHKKVVGQNQAIVVISEALRRIRANLSDENRPVSFLFLGPTGVGKTETAKALADIYFGGQGGIVRLDMSEYADEKGIEQLIGSSDRQRGVLTEKVHDNPFTLVLLDEFEKASQEVQNLFLQVLDDARLTDSRGRTISFANTIIIATSNAGSEYIREQIVKGVAINRVFQENLLNLLQSKGIFAPELLNRFDATVAFSPLAQEQQKEVARLLLTEVTKKLQEQDITLVFDDKVLTKVLSEGFNEAFGARPLRRYIQDTIEDALARKILTKEIKPGDTVQIFIDQKDTIVVSKNKITS